MVRLFLLIIMIIFIVWILRPLFNTKDRNNENTLDKILVPDQNNFRQKNIVLMIVAAIVLLALFLWILPKFGINVLALLHKIIPIISLLRGILPF